MERTQRDDERVIEGLNAAHARGKAENVALAHKVAEHLRNARVGRADWREIALLESLIHGLCSWNGHVGSFGYTGVRTRRATICLDMAWQDRAHPPEVKP